MTEVFVLSVCFWRFTKRFVRGEDLFQRKITAYMGALKAEVCPIFLHHNSIHYNATRISTIVRTYQPTRPS